MTPLNHYEQCKQLFLEHFGDREIEGIEIGTGSGLWTWVILNTLKSARIITIDPFKPVGLRPAFTKAQLDIIKSEAEKRLVEHSLRVRLLIMTSDEALGYLEGRKYDFVWIDGDHNLIQARKDIQNYLPLVKEGGIFGGHDLHIVRPLVEEALGDFEEGVDLTWWKVMHGDSN